MIAHKTIVLTEIKELPPYELEKGDSQFEQLCNYIIGHAYKVVIGTEKVFIAYLNPKIAEPNLIFKFDEAGNLINQPIEAYWPRQILKFLHWYQYESLE